LALYINPTVDRDIVPCYNTHIDNKGADMFYSVDEFNFQIRELLEQGRTLSEAGAIVEMRMAEDEAEYNDWLDEQLKQEALEGGY